VSENNTPFYITTTWEKNHVHTFAIFSQQTRVPGLPGVITRFRKDSAVWPVGLSFAVSEILHWNNHSRSSKVDVANRKTCYEFLWMMCIAVLPLNFNNFRDIQCESKKFIPLRFSTKHFPNGWELLSKILHAYCMFISTTNYKILFSYL